MYPRAVLTFVVLFLVGLAAPAILSARLSEIPQSAAAEPPAPALAPAPPPGAGPAAAPAPSADGELPRALQAELESAVQEKVRALLNETDADGQPYKRATTSRRFRKAGEAAYTTALIQDTISKDRMTTQRFLVRLEKSPGGGKWAIASMDLKDTYDNLTRSVLGDEEFLSFESFSFSREGLTVKATGGTLYKEFRDGTLESIVLSAKDLSYEYAPPEPRLQPLYKKMKKDRSADVIFNAEYVSFFCDPVSCERFLVSSFKGLAPTTQGKAEEALKREYKEYQDDVRKERKDDPFSGFRRPFQPERTYWAATVGRKGPERYIGLLYDSWAPKEVTFGIFGLDKSFPYYSPVYVYYAAETLRSGVNPYDLERRDDAEARDYDLIGLQGSVDLALQDAEELNADITFNLKTKRKLREIPFFVSRLRQTEEEKKEARNPQLIVNSIEDGEGHELTWVKTGSARGLVVLPAELPAGSQLSIRMKFQNNAAIRNFTSTFSYFDRFGWLPFVRFTDMIHDFKLTIAVPARKRILGVGRKVSEKVEGDARITEWVADSPVEFPSITFGDYMEVESKVEAKKLDGTRIPVTIHVDKSGVNLVEDIRMRDIINLTPKALQFFADQAANSINLYREIYGVDYPYGKLDLVNDPIGAFYGQSPSSLIYLGEATFASQGMAGEMGGGDLSKFNRQVVPHEVAHQWWGSLIPNYNDGNYWFVESLAEYTSALFVEFESGKPDRKAYLEKVADWRRTVMETDLQASVQDASLVWSDSLGAGYQAAVYNKGPYAFHIMRSTWGDEKFLRFLRTLASEMKNKAIVTRDIQKIAEQTFGGNMDFFFDQWIRSAGVPEYTFTYSVRRTEDGKYLVQGQVDQRVLVGLNKDLIEGNYYRAVVPITVTGKSGKEYRMPLLVEGASTPFKFKVEEEPAQVVLNKYGEALAYDTVVKAKN